MWSAAWWPSEGWYRGAATGSLRRSFADGTGDDWPGDEFSTDWCDLFDFVHGKAGIAKLAASSSAAKQVEDGGGGDDARS